MREHSVRVGVDSAPGMLQARDAAVHVARRVARRLHYLWRRNEDQSAQFHSNEHSNPTRRNTTVAIKYDWTHARQRRSTLKFHFEIQGVHSQGGQQQAHLSDDGEAHLTTTNVFRDFLPHSQAFLPNENNYPCIQLSMVTKMPTF